MNQAVSVSDIWAEPSVVAAIRLAYEESGVGGDTPVEQGGFLLRDSTSGQLEVVRLSAGAQDSFSFPVCDDGMYDGKAIVGSFHTHPNIGPEWQQEPSLQDIRLSQDYPETMGPHQFIIGLNTVYHINNEGVVSEVGITSEVLQIEPRDIT